MSSRVHGSSGTKRHDFCDGETACLDLLSACYRNQAAVEPAARRNLDELGVAIESTAPVTTGLPLAKSKSIHTAKLARGR